MRKTRAWLSSFLFLENRKNPTFLGRELKKLVRVSRVTRVAYHTNPPLFLEFTVTLTATTSICATMSVTTVSMAMSESKPDTSRQENVTLK